MLEPTEKNTTKNKKKTAILKISRLPTSVHLVTNATQVFLYIYKQFSKSTQGWSLSFDLSTDSLLEPGVKQIP